MNMLLKFVTLTFGSCLAIDWCCSRGKKNQQTNSKTSDQVHFLTIFCNFLAELARWSHRDVGLKWKKNIILNDWWLQVMIFITAWISAVRRLVGRCCDRLVIRGQEGSIRVVSLKTKKHFRLPKNKLWIETVKSSSVPKNNLWDRFRQL